MRDAFDLFDMLAFLSGLVLIIWIALHFSRRTPETHRHPGAMIGMIVWLAVFGIALYLIFG
jgi:hypothetical protein